MAAPNPHPFKQRSIDRQKIFAARVLSTVAWAGVVWWWTSFLVAHRLPGQGDDPHSLGLATIVLILISLGSVMAALPDDFVDIRGARLWLFVAWCAAPLILLVLLLSPLGVVFG